VREARGEYLTFLDADDAFLPGKLAKQVAALRAHPGADWLICGCRFAGAEGVRGERVPPDYRRDDAGKPCVPMHDAFLELRQGGLPLHTLLLRRGVFEAVGVLREDMPWLEVTEFVARLSLRFPRAVALSEVLVHINTDVPGSASKNALARSQGQRVQAESYFALAEQYSAHRVSLRRAGRRALFSHAGGLAALGDRGEALRVLLTDFHGPWDLAFLRSLARVLRPPQRMDGVGDFPALTPATR
jgi:hypothetical protein